MKKEHMFINRDGTKISLKKFLSCLENINERYQFVESLLSNNNHLFTVKTIFKKYKVFSYNVTVFFVNNKAVASVASGYHHELKKPLFGMKMNQESESEYLDFQEHFLNPESDSCFLSPKTSITIEDADYLLKKSLNILPTLDLSEDINNSKVKRKKKNRDDSIVGSGDFPIALLL